jgi:hypothetical protein
MSSESRQTSWLAYAGTLPFIFCAAAPWFGLPVLPGVGPCSEIAAAYGLAIVSFMAGVHWGTYLYQSARVPLNLFVTSNAITVSVWLAFIVTPVTIALAVLLAAFLVLLSIDTRLAQLRLLSDDYMHMRRNVTAIVVVMLVVTFAAA